MAGGRRPKLKGNEFERLVASLLAAVFPDAERGIGQARFAAEVSDVNCTPFWIECKHHKQVNVRAAMRQAREAEVAWRAFKLHVVQPTCYTCMNDRPCKKHPAAQARRRPPLVVYRDNGQPLVAMMLFNDFLQLLAKAYGVPLPVALPVPSAPLEAP